MGFSVNHKQASQGRYLPPDGEYEVVIREAAQKTTQSGKTFMVFTSEIRSDVVQEEQGAQFEHTVFKSKAPSPRDPDGYNLGQIQTICKCTRIPEGQNFEGVDDLLHALIGRPSKLRVKNGLWNDNPKIDVLWLDTEFPEVQAGVTVVNEDELPF